VSKITGLDINNILLIDNLADSYSNNKKNGIPIISYNKYNLDDIELLKLLIYCNTFDKKMSLVDQNIFHNK
jgi:hypothetical protein